jgi:hypothetical protein
MSEEVKDVERLEPIQSVSPTFPRVFISRVIEYLPPGGGVVARDCTYGSQTYSKGASLKMADGSIKYCSGDDSGTWVAKDPS